jgi:predicted enzyme related to lactoylglutathione lyase
LASKVGSFLASAEDVILNVKDMAPTVSAVKAAGGSMAGDPRRFGNTGIYIGIAIDPAGNHLELIQRP